VQVTDAERSKLVALRSDFEYYAPRCLKVKDEDTGLLVPLVARIAQRYLHERAESQRATTGKVRLLVLKGRRQGVSSYVEGRFYWRTSMTPGLQARILTHLQEATDVLFAMTQRYHDNCPAPVRPSTKNESAKALTFDKLGSEFLVATAGSKNTGRSANAHLFHGSEVAFWEHAVDHMAGIGQIVPNAPGTEIFLESTGNGVGNLFHSMWQDAVRGRSDYEAVFIPWFWERKYRLTPPADWRADGDAIEYGEVYKLDREQLYWRERKTLTDFRGEASYFDQEYPATPELAFRRQAVDTLLKIARIERAMAEKVEAIGPKIMGIDPAEAEEGGDDTVFVLRQGRAVTGYKRFHGRNTMEIVGLAARAIEEWQPDFINVDAGGLGSGIADRLAELNHPVSRVMFGARAIEQDLYGLRRDEMWGEMVKWFDGIVQLPNDEALKADLTGPIKDEDSSLRFKLETKKAMRKRGLKSPDGGDALALTFAVPAVGVAKRPNRSLERPSWRAM